MLDSKFIEDHVYLPRVWVQRTSQKAIGLVAEAMLKISGGSEIEVENLLQMREWNWIEERPFEMKEWRVYILVYQGLLRHETRFPSDFELHIFFASELNLSSTTKLRNLGDQAPALNQHVF